MHLCMQKRSHKISFYIFTCMISDLWLSFSLWFASCIYVWCTGFTQVDLKQKQKAPIYAADVSCTESQLPPCVTAYYMQQQQKCHLKDLHFMYSVHHGKCYRNELIQDVCICNMLIKSKTSKCNGDWNMSVALIQIVYRTIRVFHGYLLWNSCSNIPLFDPLWKSL